MGFDFYNCSLEIWESMGSPIPQGGSSLGSVRVHSLTLSFTPRLPHTTLQNLALVVNPRVGLRHLQYTLSKCEFNDEMNF
jgi:hypothetical protein